MRTVTCYRLLALVLCLAGLFEAGSEAALAKGPRRFAGGPARAAKFTPAKPSFKAPLAKPKLTKPFPKPLKPKPTIRLPRHRPGLHLGIGFVRPRLVVPPVVYSSSTYIDTTVHQPPLGPAGGPDLEVVDVRAAFDELDKESATITAVLKNVGQSDYRSSEGWQAFVLYMNGNLMGQLSFEDLAAGKEFSLSVQGQPGAAVYEARVLFAEEILQDGNPSNDDRNPQNDRWQQQLNPAGFQS